MNNPKKNNKLYYKKNLTRDLSKNLIQKICKLKMQVWKYNFKSQLNHFVYNYAPNDIHNLLFKKNELIGYNCLKFQKDKNKKIIIFDSLVIHKKFRNSGLSKIIMFYSIKQIKSKKINCYLKTNENLINYYQRFGWKEIKTKMTNLKTKSNERLLIYNEQNTHQKLKSSSYCK